MWLTSAVRQVSRPPGCSPALATNAPSTTAIIVAALLILVVTLMSCGAVSHALLSEESSKSLHLKKEHQQQQQVEVSKISQHLQHHQHHLKKRQRSRRRAKSNAAHQLPEFSQPIGNVTAVEGRDVRLVCTVEHLGSYQIAWLKEESKTILSIDTNIITTNYRIFLIPDEEERKWVLHIKDVQASDRGFYQCQVNTIPMRSTSGYVEVVVPPTIIESQSSQVAELIEHSNVSLQCKADGHPRPNVSWRRDDGQPIKLNGLQTTIATTANTGTNDLQPLLDEVKSDKLSLFNVDRSMAGIYVCTASNGIPGNAVRRIPLYVKFSPKTSVPNKYVAVSLTDQLELDCIIEAFPKANSYWSKRSSLQHQQPFRSGKAAAARYSSGSDRDAISMSHYTLHKQTISPIERNSSNAKQLIAQPITMSLNESSYAASKHQTAIFSSHPHNRIHFRQVDQDQFLATEPSTTVVEGEFVDKSFNQYNEKQIHSVDKGVQQQQQQQQTGSDTYVTVKQTAINAYTYKLRLIISKVQSDDFGEYVCIATSSMGTSESHVIVTRADRTGGEKVMVANQLLQDYRSSGELSAENSADFQRDSLADTKLTNQQQHRKGQHVVYDENYLAAIKTRQSNMLGSGKSYLQQQQQRLKLKARNSASGNSNLISHFTVIFICPKLLLFHLLASILLSNFIIQIG